MRQIQVIGEAARCISPEFRASHTDIPWQGIVAMRHRLVHEYSRIDAARVWDVVETDIPELIQLLAASLPNP